MPTMAGGLSTGQHPHGHDSDRGTEHRRADQRVDQTPASREHALLR